MSSPRSKPKTRSALPQLRSPTATPGVRLGALPKATKTPAPTKKRTQWRAKPALLASTVFHHYSGKPIAELVSTKQQEGPFSKPFGLWISPEGYYNWEAWTKEEGFRTNSGEFVYRIKLKPSAKICWLATAKDIADFSHRFASDERWMEGRSPPRLGMKGPGAAHKYRVKSIYWQLVAREYQGIVIAPYEDLVREAKGDNAWILGWDASTGCIWDPAAVESIELEKRVVMDADESPRKASKSPAKGGKSPAKSASKSPRKASNSPAKGGKSPRGASRSPKKRASKASV